MTDDQRSPDDGAPDQAGGWQVRLKAVATAVTDHWLVRRVMAVMEAANMAGAPLLAAALAFTTMFALVPVLLLLTGVLGWLIDDPAARADLLAQLVALVPPLEPVLAGSLEAVVEARGALSLVGLIGLLWGASNFYQALDEVMRRLFPGGEIRGFVARRVRGVVAVLVLVALIVGTIALSGLWAYLEGLVGELENDLVLWLVGLLVSVLVAVVVTLIVYRFVPTAPPTIRTALLPAIVAGTGIGLLTSLFTIVAPLLVGGLRAFGVLAAIFGAFIWLNFCYQMLLYGAAWARYRRDREKLAEG